MSTIQYSSSFDTLHSSKIYSLNWHKSSCLKKFSSHFMQHNMTFRWTSYCHHMQYRTMDLFEHRCQLLCWKRQQELVEPSPSLPASAFAEVIACKNFRACQQQFYFYNHIYKPIIPRWLMIVVIWKAKGCKIIRLIVKGACIHNTTIVSLKFFYCVFACCLQFPYIITF